MARGAAGDAKPRDRLEAQTAREREAHLPKLTFKFKRTSTLFQTRPIARAGRSMHRRPFRALDQIPIPLC